MRECYWDKPPEGYSQIYCVTRESDKQPIWIGKTKDPHRVCTAGHPPTRLEGDRKFFLIEEVPESLISERRIHWITEFESYGAPLLSKITWNKKWPKIKEPEKGNGYVYGIVLTESNSIIYVGKTEFPNRRWHELRHGAFRKDRPIDFRILEETTVSKVWKAEKYWVAKLRAEGQPLRNICDGGKGTPGLKWPHPRTEEDKERLRQSSLRYWTSNPEGGYTGHKHSEETIVQLSLSHKGPRPYRRGIKLPNISAAKKGKGKPWSEIRWTAFEARKAEKKGKI